MDPSHQDRLRPLFKCRSQELMPRFTKPEDLEVGPRTLDFTSFQANCRPLCYGIS